MYFHFGPFVVSNFHPYFFEWQAWGKRAATEQAVCVFQSWDAATAGARTDEVRCFLCGSADARRSGTASELLLRRGGSQSCSRSLLSLLSLPAKCQQLMRGKKVGRVSSRRGEVIHLLLRGPVQGQTWRFWVKEGKVLRGEEGFSMCALYIHSLVSSKVTFQQGVGFAPAWRLSAATMWCSYCPFPLLAIKSQGNSRAMSNFVAFCNLTDVFWLAAVQLVCVQHLRKPCFNDSHLKTTSINCRTL